jgi:hypothetical protein
VAASHQNYLKPPEWISAKEVISSYRSNYVPQVWLNAARVSIAKWICDAWETLDYLRFSKPSDLSQASKVKRRELDQEKVSFKNNFLHIFLLIFLIII